MISAFEAIQTEIVLQIAEVTISNLRRTILVVLAVATCF